MSEQHVLKGGAMEGSRLHSLYMATLTLTVVVCAARAGPLQDAEKELFAARYKSAAELYSKIVQADPSQTAAYYGLVRSLIEDHRSHEAYKAAEEALRRNPQTAATQTAVGLAAYRRGDLTDAEAYFRSALRMDGGFAGALQGLASISRVFSNFQTARDLVLAAYRSSPDDPQVIIAYANTLKGAEHIAALRKAHALLDAESERARELRAHIANDVAAGDRDLRRLVSPPEKTTIKLVPILGGPSRLRGFGLRVQLNRRQTVQLLLDTGASGISLSPKTAAREGLEMLGDQSADVKGIGDERTPTSYEFLASRIRIGDVEFADYPISIFRAARSADFDGLIGADVFKAFIVKIDFPRFELSLEPRLAGASSDFGEFVDASPPAAAFHRAMRFGNHLTVPTLINGGKSALFLIDSGAFDNLIDTEIGSEASKLHVIGPDVVKGIQGKVERTSFSDRVSLVFAGFRQDNPHLLAISLEKVSDEMGVALGGILGIRLLSQFSLTIDYKEGTVRFEYRKP